MDKVVRVECTSEEDADRLREVWEDLRKHGYLHDDENSDLLQILKNSTEVSGGR